MSSDGSVVAGGFASGGTTGGVFRWTEEDGYEIVGDILPTAPFMSRDGNAFAAETVGTKRKGSELASLWRLLAAAPRSAGYPS